MKEKLLSILLLSGCGLIYSSHATSTQPNNSIYSSDASSSFQRLGFRSLYSTFKQGHFLMQGGGYWSAQGKAQHIDIKGLIGDGFTVTKRHDSNGLVGLGYFFDGYRFENFQLSYGLNFFYLPRTTIAGLVIQEEVFSNLSYDYNLKHYPLYAEVQAKKTLPLEHLSLILNAGIGPNIMRAGGFSEHSVDGGITIPDEIFASHTTTTFSATAGLGLQLANVFGEIPLACGYRFFYLGQGRFAKKTDQVINTLHTGTAYANAVVCSVRI